MNKKNIINNVEKYIIFLFIFLYPLFTLPIFSNFFDISKLLLMFISLILIAIIKIFKFFYLSEVEYKSGKYDFAVFLLSLMYLITGIFGNSKFDSFFNLGSASFVILSSMFYFLINQLSSKDKGKIEFIMISSGFFLTIIQIVAFVGLLKLIPFLPEYIKTQNFTPFGTTLGTVFIVASLLPILIYKILVKKDIFEKILSSLVLLIFIISISTSIFSIFSNKESSIAILDYKTNWSVLIDSLKVNPLNGTGPSNFESAFTRHKPIEYNLRSNWDIKFVQGSSTFLTMMTETGLAGIFTLGIFVFFIFKNLNIDNLKTKSLLIILLGMSLLPLTAPIFAIMFIFLSLSLDELKTHKISIKPKLIKFLIIIPSTIFVFLVSFFGYRFFVAENYFYKSINYFSQSNGTDSYQTINKAVLLNPYSDRYHLFSAGINLAIAENMALKQELSEEDRKYISLLIQQSITEGKAAVALNKNKSVNWDALSSIYQTIFNFAEGADSFAIQTLNQAILLDPINPILRIKMGNLYYSLDKKEQAIDSLKLAVLAKPDYANSHYNLAILYKETNQIEKAKEEMNKTLNLVGKDSLDYEKAVKELQDIESLTEPQKLPDPIIEPQIELPEGSNPQG